MPTVPSHTGDSFTPRPRADSSSRISSSDSSQLVGVPSQRPNLQAPPPSPLVHRPSLLLDQRDPDPEPPASTQPAGTFPASGPASPQPRASGALPLTPSSPLLAYGTFQSVGAGTGALLPPGLAAGPQAKKGLVLCALRHWRTARAVLCLGLPALPAKTIGVLGVSAAGGGC